MNKTGTLVRSSLGGNHMLGHNETGNSHLSVHKNGVQVQVCPAGGGELSTCLALYMTRA